MMPQEVEEQMRFNRDASSAVGLEWDTKLVNEYENDNDNDNAIMVLVLALWKMQRCW
jgi:hypothetical protein